MGLNLKTWLIEETPSPNRSLFMLLCLNGVNRDNFTFTFIYVRFNDFTELLIRAFAQNLKMCMGHFFSPIFVNTDMLTSKRVGWCTGVAYMYWGDCLFCHRSVYRPLLFNQDARYMSLKFLIYHRHYSFSSLQVNSTKNSLIGTTSRYQPAFTRFKSSGILGLYSADW